jgi:phytoene dehydrogenase-like protein
VAAEQVDVVVIGSGAGGMTAALGCALAGQEVLVLEQHDRPGGWCHSFPLGGYEYSPGVHYIGDLTTGGLAQQLFEGLGLAKHLTWLELNPDGYDHVVLGDDIETAFRFDIPAGYDALQDRLIARFPSEASGIRRYLSTLRAVAEELQTMSRGRRARKTLLGSRRLARWSHTATMPLHTPNLARWGLRPLSHLLNATVSDPHLRAVLSAQVGDHGLPPSVVPTAVHASVANHYFEGGYYPKGGAKAIPRAYLRELKAHGGEIRLKASVQRILLEDGRACGVRLDDGTEIRAKTVISNADPHLTYTRMLSRDQLPAKLVKKLDKTRYSQSNLSLFGAVELDLEALGYDSGNYWFNRTPDIEGTYAKSRIPGQDAFDGCFLTITSLKDRGKQKRSTSGRPIHTIELFALTATEPFEQGSGAYGQRTDAYKARKAELTDRMITLGERVIPGLRDALVFHELGTPATNQHYVRSINGNMYGTEKTLNQVGPFAHRVSGPIDGLYLCGSSTMSHGVVGAGYSGLIAAAKATRTPVSALLDHKDADTVIWSADDVSTWPEAEQRKLERKLGAPTAQPAVAK